MNQTEHLYLIDLLLWYMRADEKAGLLELEINLKMRDRLTENIIRTTTLDSPEYIVWNAANRKIDKLLDNIKETTTLISDLETLSFIVQMVYSRVLKK